MSNQDKMLQLVLSDSSLSSYYEYNAEDYPTIQDALHSENHIVVAVAKIISGINGTLDKSVKNEIYKDVFNYLYNNIL